jgi:hypothetical protein
MAVRRQVLSHDDWVHPEFYHQTTPRKWRTINYPQMEGSNYVPSLLYQANHGFLKASPSSVEYTWIGKKLIPWQGESLSSYVEQIRAARLGVDNISEYEIAKFARGKIYRIVFVDNNGLFRSKPNVTYQAGRLNIMVGPDDIIRDVGYF